MEYLDKASDFFGITSLTPKVPYLQEIATKTKQKPQHLLLATMLVLSIGVLFTATGNLLLQIALNFLYPIYKSFKCIENKESTDSKRWIVYWMTLGFVLTCKSYLAFIFYFIPFFDLAIILGLVAVYIPSLNGYVVLYEKFFRPTLVIYEEKIDKYLQMAMDEANSRLGADKKTK